MTDEPLPPEVAETVEAIASLHAQHREQASKAEMVLDHVKSFIGQPLFIAVIFVLAAFWVGVNVGLPSNVRLDPAPFLYMQMLVALSALLLTVLILSTQIRADRLAAHREKLILQLALQSERKSAKTIALLEELRRDMPQVRNRTDLEAERMIEKVDVTAVVDALREPDPEIL